jgi:hypothetical protein
MYCKCGNEVHPVRLELGYKTCVEHSTTQTYSYVPIIEHKTGNTIQIVSQEVSASASSRKLGVDATGVIKLTRVHYC